MTEPEIHELLRSRRSPWAFDADSDCSPEDLTSLLEAARWSPSCFNEQPWYYLVCRRSEERKAWQDLLDCLVEGNRKWAQHAPVLMLVLVKNAARDEATAPFALYDTGAASLSLCLQAQALGLAAHQMAGFDTARIHERFALPLVLQPLVVIAVGRRQAAERLDERSRQRELAPRVRRPLKEFVTFGHAEFPV